MHNTLWKNKEKWSARWVKVGQWTNKCHKKNIMQISYLNLQLTGQRRCTVVLSHNHIRVALFCLPVQRSSQFQIQLIWCKIHWRIFVKKRLRTKIAVPIAPRESNLLIGIHEELIFSPWFQICLNRGRLFQFESIIFLWKQIVPEKASVVKIQILCFLLEFDIVWECQLHKPTGTFFNKKPRIVWIFRLFIHLPLA